jgi:hypothetical protein
MSGKGQLRAVEEVAGVADVRNLTTSRSIPRCRRTRPVSRVTPTPAIGKPVFTRGVAQ